MGLNAQSVCGSIHAMDDHFPTAGATRRATSYDVAKRAGVSQSAVSRCFRGGASISDDTRARVLSAARALDYTPNKIARSLMTQRSRIIAVLVTEATLSSYPNLLLHLGREIQAADHRMLVFILPGHGDGSDAKDALADILGYHIDAVISGVTLSDAMMRVCANQRLPVVAYNRPSRHAWASSVGCDDQAAMTELVAHLRAGGCRRMFFIGGPLSAETAGLRLRAAMTASAEQGVELLGVTHADYSYEGGRLAAHALFDDSVPADAIVCANDAMALGVLDHCRHDRGLNVPRDIMVTGYDDVPEGGHAAYGLTTLGQPHEALTRAAVRIACDRLDGTGMAGERRLLPVRLIARCSTRHS